MMMTSQFEKLTKSNAIKNVVLRATTEGHWKAACVKDAMVWLMPSEKNDTCRQMVRDYVSDQYDAAGIDLHGKKTTSVAK